MRGLALLHSLHSAALLLVAAVYASPPRGGSGARSSYLSKDAKLNIEHLNATRQGHFGFLRGSSTATGLATPRGALAPRAGTCLSVSRAMGRPSSTARPYRALLRVGSRAGERQGADREDAGEAPRGEVHDRRSHTGSTEARAVAARWHRPLASDARHSGGARSSCPRRRGSPTLPTRGVVAKLASPCPRRSRASR